MGSCARRELFSAVPATGGGRACREAAPTDKDKALRRRCSSRGQGLLVLLELFLKISLDLILRYMLDMSLWITENILRRCQREDNIKKAIVEVGQASISLLWSKFVELPFFIQITLWHVICWVVAGAEQSKHKRIIEMLHTTNGILSMPPPGGPSASARISCALHSCCELIHADSCLHAQLPQPAGSKLNLFFYKWPPAQLYTKLKWVPQP